MGKRTTRSAGGTRVVHLTSVHQYNDPRVFHKQCRSLAAAGFRVSLVAPCEQARDEHGVRVVPVGPWRNQLHRWFVVVPKVLLAALRLRAACYQIHDPELLLIVPFLKMTGAKIIYDIHEDYTTSLKQKRYLPAVVRPMLAWLMAVSEKAFSFGCHRIIAEKYYAERFPDATPVLNYPMRSTGTIPEAARIQLDLSPSYRWYLYTGNVTLDRGALTHLNLLRANPRAAIAYVGKCARSVANDIRAAAKRHGISEQRILLVGEDTYVSSQSILWVTESYPWVAGLALFPYTEHYARKELTKFFEYMEYGLPVLATNFDTWAALIDGQVGFTIDIDDGAAIERAARELEDGNDLRSRFAARGRELVRSEYNWTSQASRLVELYNRVLGTNLQPEQPEPTRDTTASSSAPQSKDPAELVRSV